MASFSPRSTPLSSCLFLLLLLLSFGASGVSGAYGWNECVVSPQDEWRPATERIPALRMRAEFDRRYTCNNERGEQGWVGYGVCVCFSTYERQTQNYDGRGLGVKNLCVLIGRRTSQTQ